MTSAEFWGALCFLAIAGWAMTLIFVARATLPQANALKVIEQLDARMDTRVTEIVEKYKRLVQERRPGVGPQPPAQQQSDAQRQIDRALSGIIPGFRAEQVATGAAEQPDASEGVEVVE